MKSLPILIALLALAGAAQSENTFINQYFDIRSYKQSYPENYVGPINYSVTILCKNLTKMPDSPQLFLYEPVNFSFGAVDYMGVTERIASGVIIYHPGCNLTVKGTHYMSAGEKNVTLAYMFQPAHSNVMKRSIEVHLPEKIPSIDILSPQNFLEGVLSNMLALALLAAAALLFIASTILAFTRIRLAIVGYILTVALLIGFVLVV